MKTSSRSASKLRAEAGSPVVEPATVSSTSAPAVEPVTGVAPARLPSAVRRVIGAIDWFNEALLVVLALVLGLLTCLGFAQVIARYVMAQPLVWSEELIRYALIWSVFLGAGITVRKGLLPAVEIVSHLAPETVRRLLGWVCILISAAFWLVLIVFGFVIVENVEGMNSGAMEMPMSIVYAAVPVGAVLALVNTIVAAIDPPPPSLEATID